MNFSPRAWPLATLCLIIVFSQPLARATDVTLEDNQLLVVFDAHSGALTRLENKTTHWVIERRPELGVSFRLFAPLPHRRYNPVFGPKQNALEVNKVANNQIQIKWKDLLSENGGVLPMTLTANVTLTNGTLTFAATLDNASPLTVETVDYPYFGDLNPPSRNVILAAETLLSRQTTNLTTDEVFPHFRNEKGYWGVNYPTKTLEAQSSPFCLLQSTNEGLYVGIGAPAYRLQYTFEQHPGLISSATSLVPQTDEFSGVPVNLEFRACHFVFAQPHSITVLTPVVVRGYQGASPAGVDIYTRTRAAAQSSLGTP